MKGILLYKLEKVQDRPNSDPLLVINLNMASKNTGPLGLSFLICNMNVCIKWSTESLDANI